MSISTETLERTADVDRFAFRLETILRPDGDSTLTAHGELDMSARAEFVEALTLVASQSIRVSIDLSEVSFIYSGVARAIVDAANFHSAEIEVFAPTRSVRMVLAILDADHLVVDTIRS